MHILPWLLAFNLSVLGDGYTTQRAINNGAREAWLADGHYKEALVAGLIVTDVSAILLDRSGHDKAAKWVLGLSITSHGAAATWNWHLGN